MLFDILTLFPAMFEGVFSASIIRRAIDAELISIRPVDIRDYATDRHRSADDYPYGGDAGMVLTPGPLAAAIRASTSRLAEYGPEVIFLSPQGTPFTQADAAELARKRALVLVCGHYKGIDQRIREMLVDREVSIGDYVLSGGEIPAMAVVDAVTRLIPGVLGNRESAEQDSFFQDILGPPEYTRPEVFEGMAVPGVLLSGHHENIRKWRREQARRLTRERRPDVWERLSRQSTEG